jgi:hypothetical protein
MKFDPIKILIAVLMLVSSTAVYAYDFEVDGIYYTITSKKKKTVKVTFKRGQHYKGNIVVPATAKFEYQTYQVTGVVHHAFYSCADLKKVTLPAGIKKIGVGAFSFCSSLTELALPDSLERVGRQGFAYCSRMKHITVPAKVTKVGRNAFLGSFSLKYVALPEQIEKVERLGISKHVRIDQKKTEENKENKKNKK